MNDTSLATILISLAALYSALAAGRFSKFFGNKAKLIKIVQNLNCGCTEGIVSAIYFSQHYQIKLIAEDLHRAGQIRQADAVGTLYTEVDAVKERIETYLQTTDDSIPGPACDAVAEDLGRWRSVAHELTPDWRRILIPFSFFKK